MLCKEAEVQAHITIDLLKRIPVGAGLGGGSSDAAAVLKGLNALLLLGFDEPRLCALATRLGADVPFFIPCCPSRVQGIGEILTPVFALPPKWFVVVVPPFGVSTLWAYRRFDELPEQKSPGSKIELTNGRWPLGKLLVNDLERAVISAYPSIGELKQQLLQLGAEECFDVWQWFSRVWYVSESPRCRTGSGHAWKDRKSFCCRAVERIIEYQY